MPYDVGTYVVHPRYGICRVGREKSEPPVEYLQVLSFGGRVYNVNWRMVRKATVSEIPDKKE